MKRGKDATLVISFDFCMKEWQNWQGCRTSHFRSVQISRMLVPLLSFYEVVITLTHGEVLWGPLKCNFHGYDKGPRSWYQPGVTWRLHSCNPGLRWSPLEILNGWMIQDKLPFSSQGWQAPWHEGNIHLTMDWRLKIEEFPRGLWRIFNPPDICIPYLTDSKRFVTRQV